MHKETKTVIKPMLGLKGLLAIQCSYIISFYHIPATLTDWVDQYIIEKVVNVLRIIPGWSGNVTRLRVKVEGCKYAHICKDRMRVEIYD